MIVEKVEVKYDGWSNRLYIKTDKVIVKVSKDSMELFFGKEDDEDIGNIENWFEIPLTVGLTDMKTKKFSKSSNVLTLIEFYQEKKDFLRKLKKLETNYKSFWDNHRKLIAFELERMAKDKVDDKTLEEFLENLKKVLERSKKNYIIKETLAGEMKPFSYSLSYWFSDFDGKRVIIIKTLTGGQDIYLVIIAGKDLVEIRKTKSFTTIYNIVKENRFNEIGRLNPITPKDLEYLSKENLILLIKGIIFDLEEEIRNKVINLLTISCI